MTLEVSINLQSLRQIQDQIDETIAQAATDLEAYLADQAMQSHLKDSHEAATQLAGTFRLLECPGLAALAEEIGELLHQQLGSPETMSDSVVAALTHAFFVLPRYVEYITLRQKELPILLVPYINEMRICRRAPLMPEHYFSPVEFAANHILSERRSPGDIPTLLATTPRLRQMYQMGLLGVLTNHDEISNYHLMRRAVSRYARLLGDHPSAEMWRLARLMLEAFSEGKLELTLNRKRILADFEKQFRQVASRAKQGLEHPFRDGLKNDVLFMLGLSSFRSDEVAVIRDAYSLSGDGIDDDEIAKQRNLMHGPSIDAMESVAKALSEELRNAKDILEVGSQNSRIEDEDLALLTEIIRRIADTLLLLNLTGPRETLLELLGKIEEWPARDDSDLAVEFIQAADVLLYIDSALSSLDQRQLTVEDLNQATALTRKKIIANSQLAKAEQLVIEEAQSGIALAKRAITAYVDSNFDRAHIANVGVSLRTVRGGLKILNYRRATAVLESSYQFVDHHIHERKLGDENHQLLETLADALISVEYYLTELETSRKVNEDILEVAEQSLAALGFAVAEDEE